MKLTATSAYITNVPTEKMSFEYNTVLHLARIRRFINGTDNHVSPAFSIELKEGEWHDFKVDP